MKITSHVVAFTLLLVGTLSSHAQVKLEGSFVASKACAALQSIKTGSNAGNVSVDAGETYALLGKNKDEASHYWIVVPGAQPEQRWVAVDCGSANGKAATVAPQKKILKRTQDSSGDGAFYILALSWQPAFCEGHSGKQECKFASTDDYESTHFVLHGLWPQPRSNVFCGVHAADKAQDDNHRWESLPPPDLTASTRAALERVMPGTQSMLERHEYIKHGTCYSGSGEQYFKDSVRLVEAVNASPVQALVSARVGKFVTTAELRAAFDEGFGKGAGQRIRVACDRDRDRMLITEITIGLRGDIPGGASIADLMHASTPTEAGCPGGIVDPAGRQ